MGNLTYVSSPRRLDFDAVDAQIREINERRFGGYFTIKRSAPQSWVGADGWEFWCDAYDKAPLFGYRLLDTKRRISGGHARPGWKWADWCVAVFENELGAAWGGRISDDGVEETWAPVADKYPAFRDWQEMWFQMYDHLPPDDAFRETLEMMRGHEISEIPESLRPFAVPDV